MKSLCDFDLRTLSSFGGGGLGGRDFPGGSAVRNLPTMQDLPESGFDPWLGKIPMEEGMETRFSILAWGIS